MPKQFTLAADASQVDQFLQCPTSWYWKYRRNLSISKEEGIYLTAGTYGHHLLDQYYKRVAMGDNLNDAFAFAIGLDVDNGNPGSYPLSMEKRQEIKDKLLVYIACHPIDRDVKPLNADSVELGFSEKLYEDKTNLFIIEGRIDFIGHLGSGLTGFVDHKFQWKKQELYPKSVQFKTYSLVTKYRTGLINYIRMTKKNDEETFVRRIVQFSPYEIQRWKETLIATFFKMKAAILDDKWTGASDYYRNLASCNRQHREMSSGYYRCEYTELCEETNSNVMEAKAKLFHVKPEWRPW